MQPKRNIMKLGSKLLAVGQCSKFNWRDASNFENIPDVFRGWLAKRKVNSTCTLWFHCLFACCVFFSFSEKKCKINNPIDFISFPGIEIK